MSIADIGREAAEASTAEREDGGQSEYDYERIDVSDASFVKMHPGPTAVEATVTGLRYFAPYNDGEFDEDGRGAVHVVVEDMAIPSDDSLEGVAIFESASDTGDDFKVVNTEDDNVDVYDIGVSVGQMFESEQVDEFGIDGQAVLKLSTGSGRSVARTLDVNGLPNADVVRDEDGTPVLQDSGFPTSNNGLIEKHPDNDDDFYEPPRYHRDPQLRPDVEGERVIILLQHMSNVVDDYDGNAHWATVLAELDDERMSELAELYAEDPFYSGSEPEDFIRELDGREFIKLAPTSEFEPDEELVYETAWLDWNYPDDDELERLQEEQGH